MPAVCKRTVAFPLGKEMWKKELADHQKRLQSVKTTLAPSAPAAPPSSSRGGLGSSRGNPRRVGSPLKLRGVPASDKDGPAAATSDTTGDEVPPSISVEQLSPEDQSTCRSIIEMLRRMTTAQSKAILEEVFVASEMQRLLSHYTGVYSTDTAAPPTATSSEQQTPRPQKHSARTSSSPTSPKEHRPSNQQTNHKRSSGDGSEGSLVSPPSKKKVSATSNSKTPTPPVSMESSMPHATKTDTVSSSPTHPPHRSDTFNEEGHVADKSKPEEGPAESHATHQETSAQEEEDKQTTPPTSADASQRPHEADHQRQREELSPKKASKSITADASPASPNGDPTEEYAEDEFE